MPKIPSLPAITAPDASDELPIEDVSVNTTKKITLTVLKEWFQSLTGWISTAMLANDSVTPDKVDGFDMCILRKSGDQSVSAGTNSAITWQVEDLDTNTMHDNSSNTSRVTIKKTGVYHITGQIRVGSLNDAKSMFVNLHLNGSGSNRVSVEYQTAFNGSTMIAPFSGYMQLNANDYIEMYLANGDSASRNVTANYSVLSVIQVA